MPKTKLGERVKELSAPPKVDREFWQALGGGLERNRIKSSEAAEARFLEIAANTYRAKKEDPDKFTLKELRRIISKLDLTSEEVGKFMGCKR